jgi:hypothetical protein
LKDSSESDLTTKGDSYAPAIVLERVEDVSPGGLSVQGIWKPSVSSAVKTREALLTECRLLSPA